MNKQPKPSTFRAKRGVGQDHLATCLDHLRPDDLAELNDTFGGHWSRRGLAASWCQAQCDGLTLFDGEQVVACLLAWSPLPGQWTCGMVATKHWRGVAWSASRYLKRYLAPVLMGQRVRRASCVVAASNRDAVRWLEFLGFGVEGHLKRYGISGDDFLMTAFLPALSPKSFKQENDDV